MGLLKDYSKRIGSAKKYINLLTDDKKERKDYLKIWALSGMPLIKTTGVQPSFDSRTKVLTLPNPKQSDPNKKRLMKMSFGDTPHKDFFFHEAGHSKTDKATRSSSVNRLKMYQGYKLPERLGILTASLLGGKTTTALALLNEYKTKKYGHSPLLHSNVFDILSDFDGGGKTTPSEIHSQMSLNPGYYAREEKMVAKRKSGEKSIQKMLEDQFNILQDPKYNKNYLSKIVGNLKLLSKNYKDTKNIRKKVKENYLKELNIPELIELNKSKKPINLDKRFNTRDKIINYHNKLFDAGIDSGIY
tara:strand:+ start:92 stop:997 length:906 start_codon:yes stop_codon:yes gene_type:complete